MKEVLSVTNLKEWATIAKMRTSQSAMTMTSRYRSRFPDYVFDTEKHLIRAFSPKSSSLVKLARERDEAGRIKYGENWEGRDPIVEAREELADAYNYFQWAHDQNKITLSTRDYLMAKVLELDHDLRLLTECPSSTKARRIRLYIPKGYVAEMTIGGDENGQDQ